MRLIYLILFLSFPSVLFGQGLDFGDGVDKTLEDGLLIVFDNFTGETVVTIDSSAVEKQQTLDENKYTMPVAIGDTGLFGYYYDWIILFYLKETQMLDIEDGDHFIPLLADEERLRVSAEISKKNGNDFVYQILAFDLLESEWNTIRSADKVRYRVSGSVKDISAETLNHMTKISNKVSQLENEKESGSSMDTESEATESTSPIEISWEGGIDRVPIVSPLPENTSNSEGVITVRIEVMPGGSVGRVIPLRKINPELEREVMRTLRSWRFSSLPDGVPKNAQSATVTFRFVIE